MKNRLGNIDRQIAFWGGWIGGPAFGVAMMAAPEYFRLQPTVAAACFWAGILIFALTVFVVFALSAREQERKHRSMWPIALMALGAIIFGVGVAAFFWPSAVQRSELNNVPPAGNIMSETGQLLLECQQMALPDVGFPRETSLMIVNPFRFEKQGTIGLSMTPTSPGAPIKFPDEWKNKMMSSARCRLTNYGKTTLFNVEVPISITFKRIRRGDNPGSSTASEVINTAEMPLPITKIDPGAESAYIFYIHNQGRDVIEPLFPETASYLPAGTATRRPITLVQSSSVVHRYVSLWPLRSVEEILADDEKSNPKQ